MDGRHPGNEAAELCRHGQLTVFSQGDLRNGVAYCRRASELDPQNSYVRDTLACFLHSAGARDALQKLREAIQKSPNIGYEKFLRFAASYPSSTSHQGTAATENEIAEALKALSEGSRILIDTMERLDLTKQANVTIATFYEETLFLVFNILARIRFVQNPASLLWKDVLYQAYAAYPELPTPLLVRARLSYCVSDFVDVIKTLHIYVAMWRPHLLRDADLYRAEIEAKAWLLPVKMSEFDIGAYLGNLPQRDESIIVDAATGRCKLPDIFRSSEEITQVGRLLCEAGDFETGIRVIKDIVETDPRCGEAWLEYIVLHFELNYEDHAEDMLHVASRQQGLRLGCANWPEFVQKVKVAIKQRRLLPNKHLRNGKPLLRPDVREQGQAEGQKVASGRRCLGNKQHGEVGPTNVTQRRQGEEPEPEQATGEEADHEEQRFGHAPSPPSCEACDGSVDCEALNGYIEGNAVDRRARDRVSVKLRPEPCLQAQGGEELDRGASDADAAANVPAHVGFGMSLSQGVEVPARAGAEERRLPRPANRYVSGGDFAHEQGLDPVLNAEHNLLQPPGRRLGEESEGGVDPTMTTPAAAMPASRVGADSPEFPPGLDVAADRPRDKSAPFLMPPPEDMQRPRGTRITPPLPVSKTRPPQPGDEGQAGATQLGANAHKERQRVTEANPDQLLEAPYRPVVQRGFERPLKTPAPVPAAAVNRPRAGPSLHTKPGGVGRLAQAASPGSAHVQGSGPHLPHMHASSGGGMRPHVSVRPGAPAPQGVPRMSTIRLRRDAAGQQATALIKRKGAAPSVGFDSPFLHDHGARQVNTQGGAQLHGAPAFRQHGNDFTASGQARRSVAQGRASSASVPAGRSRRLSPSTQLPDAARVPQQCGAKRGYSPAILQQQLEEEAQQRAAKRPCPLYSGRQLEPYRPGGDRLEHFRPTTQLGAQERDHDHTGRPLHGGLPPMGSHHACDDLDAALALKHVPTGVQPSSRFSRQSPAFHVGSAGANRGGSQAPKADARQYRQQEGPEEDAEEERLEEESLDLTGADADFQALRKAQKELVQLKRMPQKVSEAAKDLVKALVGDTVDAAAPSEAEQSDEEVRGTEGSLPVEEFRSRTPTPRRPLAIKGRGSSLQNGRQARDHALQRANAANLTRADLPVNKQARGLNSLWQASEGVQGGAQALRHHRASMPSSTRALEGAQPPESVVPEACGRDEQGVASTFSMRPEGSALHQQKGQVCTVNGKQASGAGANAVAGHQQHGSSWASSGKQPCGDVVKASESVERNGDASCMLCGVNRRSKPGMPWFVVEKDAEGLGQEVLCCGLCVQRDRRAKPDVDSADLSCVDASNTPVARDHGNSNDQRGAEGRDWYNIQPVRQGFSGAINNVQSPCHGGRCFSAGTVKG